MANRAKKTVIVQTAQEWNALDSDVSIVFVKSYSCNDASLTVLNVSRLTSLQELSIGDYCFENVKELRLVGLSGLKRVAIGSNSFTKSKNGFGSDPNRRFQLKDCSALTELRVGRYSFSDYSVCEIENVDALESIAMGELNSESFNFHSASLELKSGIGGFWLCLDFPTLKSLLFGSEVMTNCDRAVFESVYCEVI